MDENQNNVLSNGKLLTCWPAKPQCPHTARATSFLLSGSDDVFNLIQSILGPLANADAWKQHALLKLLEGCLIEDRVMTDSVAINRVRCLYLAFIEESAIPDGLDNWIRRLRSRNVSIDRLRSGLDLKKRQVINDNATIDGVHSGLTGSTVDHSNDEPAADGIQAPNQQDAGRLQVQRSAAVSNLRGLGHGEEGDESTPSEGDYGSSTVGYHVSRGSDGTNPNGDA
jgi:hypothetical protein